MPKEIVSAPRHLAEPSDLMLAAEEVEWWASLGPLTIWNYGAHCAEVNVRMKRRSTFRRPRSGWLVEDWTGEYSEYDLREPRLTGPDLPAPHVAPVRHARRDEITPGVAVLMIVPVIAGIAVMVIGVLYKAGVIL